MADMTVPVFVCVALIGAVAVALVVFCFSVRLLVEAVQRLSTYTRDVRDQLKMLSLALGHQPYNEAVRRAAGIDQEVEGSD